MPAATTGELRALMSRAVFARDYGFHLESADDDRCTLRVPFDERLERPGGVIGGPAFMAAADVATWLAILARLGAGDQSVTSSLVTTFLAPARREDFVCTARIHRIGRRLIYATAECLAEDGRLLTHHSVTYIRPDASGSRRSMPS